MIKNYSQFKTYFYLYLLDFEEIPRERLEKYLKKYLMYHGVSVGRYEPMKDDPDKYYMVGTYICHDLDELVMHYNQFNDIN